MIESNASGSPPSVGCGRIRSSDSRSGLQTRKPFGAVGWRPMAFGAVGDSVAGHRPMADRTSAKHNAVCLEDTGCRRPPCSQPTAWPTQPHMWRNPTSVLRFANHGPCPSSNPDHPPGGRVAVLVALWSSVTETKSPKHEGVDRHLCPTRAARRGGLRRIRRLEPH